jgi:hypothetical protein
MVKGWSNFDMVGHLMMAFFCLALRHQALRRFRPRFHAV